MEGTIAAVFSTSAFITYFLPCAACGVGLSVLLQNNHCKRSIWCVVEVWGPLSYSLIRKEDKVGILVLASCSSKII